MALMTPKEQKGKLENSPWQKLTATTRKRLIWWIWLTIWLVLLVGLFDRSFYQWAVNLSALHSLFFLWLFSFQIKPLPVQVRLAYLIWVFVGTYVPGFIFLMYITTVGLAANLFLNYCPLARLLLLLSWNRSESLSIGFLKEVFFSPPSAGRFVPRKHDH